MSCNGCRVLRKGCSETCVLRQCLRSIDSPDAQGHATSFVAKFFGRARMMTLISSVPDNQRPALFQSLLYEACGRTINPVFGAVGLLCSGNWKVCQEAVETVMKGGAETVLMKGGGLICSPSSGSGRQQIHLTMQQIHHQTAAAAAAAKVRSGRGFAMISHATSSCNSDQVDVKLGVKRKEELDEEMNKQRLMKQRRLLNRRQEVTSLISRGGGDGDEAEGEADKNAEGVGKKLDLACNDEQGPGLDLTLGTAALSCYGDEAAADDDQDHHPGTGFTAKYVNRCSRARRSSPSSGEHSHSSEAVSDTTDLSISIQSRSAAAAAAASTTRRDLLLDLLH